MDRDSLSTDDDLEIATAPKYPIRGHQLGYRPKTNSYDGWNVAQWEQYMRDLAVFGTNAIELIPPLNSTLRGRQRKNGELDFELESRGRSGRGRLNGTDVAAQLTTAHHITVVVFSGRSNGSPECGYWRGRETR